MRSLKVCLVLMLLAFCGQISCSHKSPGINNKIEIYAYHWRMPEEEHLYNWIFILGYYIEIDETGNTRVKRWSYNPYPQGEYEYFSKQLPDSINQLIKMVDFSDLGSVYNLGEDSTSLYSGSTYILKYNDKYGNPKYFRYIPGSDINPQYLILHRKIESFVEILNSPIDSFNIDDKIDYLIKHQVEDTSQLPRKLGTIKFIPSK